MKAFSPMGKILIGHWIELTFNEVLGKEKMEPTFIFWVPGIPEAIRRGACNFVFVIRARGGRVPFNEV